MTTQPELIMSESGRQAKPILDPDRLAALRAAGTKPRTKRDFYGDRDHPVVGTPCWDAIPVAMKAERRWLLWRLDWRDKGDGSGEWGKVPYQPDGRHAKSNDPATW